MGLSVAVPTFSASLSVVLGAERREPESESQPLSSAPADLGYPAGREFLPPRHVPGKATSVHL